MFRKILYAVAAFLLVVLPILGSIALSKFSPYFKPNGWGIYITGCIIYIIVSAIAGWLLARKTLAGQMLCGGFMLYLIGAALVAVAGLATAPDFGPDRLKYP